MRDTPSSPTNAPTSRVLGYEFARRVFAELESSPTATPHQAGRDERPRGGSIPRIDGYLIERELGAGATAVVYAAIDLRVGRAVAIKVLHAGQGSPRRRQRHWHELEWLRQLDVPGVPKLLDFGILEGRPYFVTERVEGDSVDRHAASRSMVERVALLAKVTDILQRVHERGVIHRDIKPSNVLVNDAGDPTLLDFGLARLAAMEAQSTLSVDGCPLGTPAYMAPEQARGEQNEISTRSDVYSIGALAFAILVGEPPHAPADTLAETIRRVAFEPPRDARQIDPGCPSALAKVLAKATRQRAADRYASAAEFGDDLRRWLRREPVLAAPRSWWGSIGIFAARHVFAATVAGGVTIAAIVILLTVAVTWWLAQEPRFVTLDPAVESTAQLVSVTGRQIREWTAQGRVGIRAAFAVPPSSSPDGRGRVVLGFEAEGTPGQSGELQTWSFERTPRLLWRVPGTDPASSMPAPLSEITGTTFRVAWALPADVFGDARSELIVCHAHHPHSAQCLRVYSLDGAILFEAWHDGELSSGQWLSSARLIVCCGVNSEATIAERGGSEVGDVLYPRVLVSIRPIEGARQGWIRPRSDDPTSIAQWYWSIGSLSQAPFIREGRDAMRIEPAIGPPNQDVFRLSLELEGRTRRYGGIGLFVTGAGELAPSRLQPSSVFQASGCPVRADEILLRPLPPIAR